MQAFIYEELRRARQCIVCIEISSLNLENENVPDSEGHLALKQQQPGRVERNAPWLHLV
jgi:hypothetical protein